jgi:hypothetical protein
MKFTVEQGGYHGQGSHTLAIRGSFQLDSDLVGRRNPSLGVVEQWLKHLDQ